MRGDACSNNLSSNTKPQPVRFATGDEYYIRIAYKGDAKVFVSVFRVDAAGKSTHVTRSWERGISLSRERRRQALKGGRGEPDPPGIPIGWPKSVPTDGPPVEEAFVFILTEEEVDLGFLETSSAQDYLFAKAERSSTAFRRSATPYDVLRIEYLLHPPENSHDAETPNQRRVAATELPAPEMTTEGKNLIPHLQQSATAAKGFIGAAARTLRGVPPYVWVVNAHDEEITVAVSRYRPQRLLSGVSVNASATGAGLEFSTTVRVSSCIGMRSFVARANNFNFKTYSLPATAKTLAPRARDPERSVASFPLWTRYDGFGVISIYVGIEQRLYISEDRVPIGATVYFTNKPNLTIVKFDERGGLGIAMVGAPICRVGEDVFSSENFMAKIATKKIEFLPLRTRPVTLTYFTILE